MGKKILWLLGKGENRNRINYILRKMREIHLPVAEDIMFIQVNKGFPFWVKKPKTKETYMLTENYREQVTNTVGAAIHSASMVVINDFSVLSAVLDGEVFGKKKLMSFRGGKYISPLFGNLPAIVVDDVSKAYMPPSKNPNATLQESPSLADQLNEFDFTKIVRHHLGLNFDVPAFDERYELIEPYITNENTGKFSLSPQINEFLEWLQRQTALGLDYETTGVNVSCLGVSGIENNDINTIKTYVLPLVDTTTENLMYMDVELFMKLHKAIYDTKAFKIWANGMCYDLNYSYKYHAFKNQAGRKDLTQHHDIMHLWHSYRPRLPKALSMVSSIFDDNYYYWKEEIKGGSKEKAKQKTKYALPTTADGMRVYWRYCGLDCHSTLVSFLQLSKKVMHEDWVYENYAREMALQQGPLMKSNYIGAKMNVDKLKSLIAQDKLDFKTSADNLEIASNGIVHHGVNAKGEPQFGTNQQLIDWLYHAMLARAGKQKANKQTPYSVDQKQLKLVAEQHPVYAKAIEMIREVREPEQRVKMYGKMTYHKERFNYNYTTLGTYTGRFSGRGSAFWTGTNPQNVPYHMKPMVVCDRGRIMLDFDYSQADSYHFAVACNDKNMIETVFDDRDTHSVHVEMILKVPYDEIMEKKFAKKGSDDWLFVNDPIRGVRQIIKKVCHGGNYGMLPPTAYLNIGRDALEAAADYLGYDHGKWSYSRFLAFTEELTEPYFAGYPRQMEFRKEIVEQCCANDGYMQCAGGLRVYFHEHKNRREHDALCRALLAFFGQGGTAAMINQAILNMYYKPYKDGKSFLEHYNTDFLFQTHDSLAFYADIETAIQTPLIKELHEQMEVVSEFNGQKYIVPVEGEIGFAWGKTKGIERNDEPKDILFAGLKSWADVEGIAV